MGDQTPTPQPDQPETETEHLVAGLFGGQVKTQETSERDYLLREDILSSIREPFAEIGLVIETDPVTMYDYDTTIKYDFYRVPLDQGHLALIYLKGRITESYHHLNNPLPMMYIWLTDANPDLDIQAVCFFTDGELVDPPFATMIDGWKKRGDLRFVEIVVKKNWQVLQNQEHAARVVALKRLFGGDELAPPPAPAGDAPAAETGDEGGLPPGGTVADLKNDDFNKNRLVTALTNYLQSGHPTPVSEMTSNLIDQTVWPTEWKNLRKAALSEIAAANALNLVDYAINMGNLPAPNQDETALGSLLAKARPLLGGADLTAVDEIIAAFNL